MTAVTEEVCEAGTEAAASVTARWGGRLRACLPYVAASIAVLVPCFWQARIQAGDLSSHLYNAWLAQLIEHGQAPGLRLAWQSNNVLFDLVLGGLLRWWGAETAQRVAVSLAVLAFFWGTFAFVWSCARPPRRAPWTLAPCLAMLAYGWVFHMGLFNFYISLGLSFGGLALAFRPRGWAIAAAIPVFGLAYVAHAMPVAWAAAVLAYYWVARMLAPRYRILLGVGALGILVMLAAVLCAKFYGRWSPEQFVAVTGAEQIWVFGRHYIFITAALLGVWIVWFQRTLETRGSLRALLDPRFQLCLLCAFSVVIIPGSVLLPAMRHTLNVMAQRMSLATAVMVCGVAASLRPRRGEMVALAAIAAVFFGCMYADEHALNRLETSMAQAVAPIPPGQRVISVLAESNIRVNSLTHMVDRICTGRCFSYANYEPSTAQFRVRAEQPNGIVAWQYGQSWDMQSGGYVVQARDLPLYQIDVCHPAEHGICVTALQAGDKLRDTWLHVATVLGEWDNRHDGQ